MFSASALKNLSYCQRYSARNAYVRSYNSAPKRSGSSFREEYARLLKPELFPIYTLFGMTALAVFLATHTMKQELMHSPSVSVDKKKRKDIPEINDPQSVLKNSENLVNKSFIRRVGQTTSNDTEPQKAMR